MINRAKKRTIQQTDTTKISDIPTLHDIDSGIQRDDKTFIITWSTRKKLSIAAFAANVLIILLVTCLIPIDKINAIKDIINSFIYGNVILIISYFGSTTLPYLQHFGKK